MDFEPMGQSDEQRWAEMVRRHSAAVLRVATQHATSGRKEGYLDVGRDLWRVMKDRWCTIYRCGLGWESIPCEFRLQAVAVLRYGAAAVKMADIEMVREYVYDGPRERGAAGAPAP